MGRGSAGGVGSTAWQHGRHWVDSMAALVAFGRQCGPASPVMARAADPTPPVLPTRHCPFCRHNAACAANLERVNVTGLASPHCRPDTACAPNTMPPMLPTWRRRTSQGSPACAAALPTRRHPRCDAPFRK